MTRSLTPSNSPARAAGRPFIALVALAAQVLTGLMITAGQPAHAQGQAPAPASADAPAMSQQQIEAGLLAIESLARVNGQALACHEMAVAKRAKSLMLAHAPKTPRYGSLYEETTQRSYMELAGQQGICPEERVLRRRLDEIERHLRAALPAQEGAR